MRKKVSIGAAGLLAAAALSVGPASPAAAQPQSCTSTDPVLAYACQTIDNVGPWAEYYYYKAGETVKDVYCLVWPELCL